MCVLGISVRVCMSIVQKLAMGLHLADKDIPACSPINSDKDNNVNNKVLKHLIVSRTRVFV